VKCSGTETPVEVDGGPDDAEVRHDEILGVDLRLEQFVSVVESDLPSCFDVVGFRFGESSGG
jgi:hypothetical protein